MKHGNVIVGQSGGPTAVINSSLAGVFNTARDRGANKVFAIEKSVFKSEEITILLTDYD